MLDMMLNLLQTVGLLLLAAKLYREEHTIRIVSRMAAGTAQQPPQQTEIPIDQEKAKQEQEAINRFTAGIGNILAYTGEAKK